MTPEQFVAKWSRAELSERAASQEHFIDLCHLLGQPTPAEADGVGDEYTFEKSVKVVGAASKGSKGQGGYVDVWKRGCFAWEYKQKDKYKSLDEAYRQVYQYRDALENPPLSVVCDIRTTEIRTHFAGFPTEKITIQLEQLPGKLEVLRRVFTYPDSFKAALKSTAVVTQELADEFAKLASRLIERYPPSNLTLFDTAGDPVAHFLMKVMFCLFAESVGLLPDRAFTKLINRCLFEPESFEGRATNLFQLMRTGGEFGFDVIPYFNGGLFDEAPALPLNSADLNALRRVCERDWSGVEPSIFGTLFERILDPRKRAQIGAHYTSKDDIKLVIDPVIMTPLRRRWQQTRDALAPTLAKHNAEPDRKKRQVFAAPIKIAVEEFRRHLSTQRVLDPACGSGNFLYVALQELLDLEDEAVIFASRHDISVNPVPLVRPTQMHGIEINPYAAELAQVVIWIGYLQWMHIHGISDERRPILDKLQCIENRDAILDLSEEKNPKPAEWPDAEFVVGNPPFLGSKMFREQGLSHEYVEKMFAAFDLPRTSDLCCYWFELARRKLAAHPTLRAGLLATQGIRGRDNRAVLQRVRDTGDIFTAWSDRDWVLDGAAVHVSIVGFGGPNAELHTLNGIAVGEINSDLSADADLTTSRALSENAVVGWSIGTQKGGAFDIDHATARALLSQPNPNGKSSIDVVRPWLNASDLVGRLRGLWIIDFGTTTSETDASGYEAPFEHVPGTSSPSVREIVATHTG